jgi:hypothetical protein
VIAFEHRQQTGCDAKNKMTARKNDRGLLGEKCANSGHRHRLSSKLRLWQAGDPVITIAPIWML